MRVEERHSGLSPGVENLPGSTPFWRAWGTWVTEHASPLLRKGKEVTSDTHTWCRGIVP